MTEVFGNKRAKQCSTDVYTGYNIGHWLFIVPFRSQEISRLNQGWPLTDRQLRPSPWATGITASVARHGLW